MMYPRASSSPFGTASRSVRHSAIVTILLSLQTPWSSGEVQRAFGAGGGRTMRSTLLRSTTLQSTTLQSTTLQSTTLRSPDLVVLWAALLATRMRRRSSRCAMTPSLSFPVSLSSSILYPSAMLHSFFFSEGSSGRAVVDEDGVDGGLISMIIFWPVCLGWTNGQGVGFDRLGPIELTPGGGGRPRL